MAVTGRRLWRAALVAGTSLMLITVGGPAVAAPTPPGGPLTPATDCFGNPINTLTVLGVPPGGAPFFGTAGDDVIIGTAGPDHIYGLAGNDTICSGDGEDLIYGDGGNDDIDGERGTDELHGGGGDDDILGGTNTPGYPYHEAIYGDDGNDHLQGQSGPDTLLCGNPFIGGDPGDIADGGTGMAGGQPEDDIVWTPADCPIIANVP
jgi:Ca2+-binding RTX toxin-like protein